MKHTREQKRAKLLAAAQAVIEGFLDWEEQAAQPNLTAIEDEVLRAREQFGQRLAEVALADQDSETTRGGACVSELWAAAALQGAERLGSRKPSGLIESRSRALLLRSLPQRAFSPWMTSWRCGMGTGAKRLRGMRCG